MWALQQELVNHSNDQSHFFTGKAAVEIHSTKADISDKIRAQMGWSVGASLAWKRSVPLAIENEPFKRAIITGTP